MDIRIVPGLLRGTIAAPASKSELHRYLICAAFSDRPTVVEGAGDILPDDITATVFCLEGMGASFRHANGKIEVTPAEECPDCPELNCGGSGSTLRFLLPLAAAKCAGARFTGNGSLAARPVRELLQALEQNGARFSGIRLPFRMEAGMSGHDFSVPGNVSSQYVSGLMMAGAVSGSDTVVRVTSELGSAGYVYMTADALRRFGADVEEDKNTFRVRGPLRSPGLVRAGGSWSAAAAMLAAAACQENSNVTVTGLDTESLQGDRAVLDIVRGMGAEISAQDGSVRVKGSPLNGTDLDVDMIPDLFPVLAAAAAGADGISFFRNAARLRLKESDRLDSIHRLLSSLGVSCRESADGLEVAGSSNAHAGTVSAEGDHRVVMAAAVAAYALGVEVTVSGAEHVSKSYPYFFEDLRRLGGRIDVV